MLCYKFFEDTFGKPLLLQKSMQQKWQFILGPGTYVKQACCDFDALEDLECLTQCRYSWFYDWKHHFKPFGRYNTVKIF